MAVEMGHGFQPTGATAVPAQQIKLGTPVPVSGQAVSYSRDDLLVGEVVEVSGSASKMLLDAKQIAKLGDAADQAVAMAGQVGAQVKIRVGHVWLLASIREEQLHPRDSSLIIATVDFLGEGDEEKLTGRIFNFRRGVTRFPVPGSQVYAATTNDLKQIYAADERPHIEIGTVYPTKDIRG